MSDKPSPEDRKTLGLLEYRLDRHGEELRDIAVRLRVVEDRHAEVRVLQQQMQDLKADVHEGFTAQGEEIGSLRRAVVGAAVAIAGSAIILALTVVFG